MARIVYGVSGEGSGHSSRAREMIAHLESRGHVVRAVSYDRGYRNLRDDFDVFETEGLHIACVDNKVSVVRTIAGNLRRVGKGIGKWRELKRTVFKEFDPDCIITDFEPMTGYLARLAGLPLISLDNQHRMRYMEYPMPPGLRKDAFLTETVIRAMVPAPDVSLVTTFYFGKVKNDRTFLFPPILRESVTSATPTRGEHVLIYLTDGFESFLRTIAERFSGERFIVYGCNREETCGHMTYKLPSQDGFLRDLAGCKAVMSTAGYTLMTEAFFFGKPLFSLPMVGQFEQELNAFLLDQLGYGMACPRPMAEDIEGFLKRLPEYEKRVADYRREDNSAIKTKLDDLLADDLSLLREFRRQRKST